MNAVRMQTYDFCCVPSKRVETLSCFSTPQFAGLVKGACGNLVSERENERERARKRAEREKKRTRAPAMTQSDKWSHCNNNTSYPAVP